MAGHDHTADEPTNAMFRHGKRRRTEIMSPIHCTSEKHSTRHGQEANRILCVADKNIII